MITHRDRHRECGPGAIVLAMFLKGTGEGEIWGVDMRSLRTALIV